jgi:hypothetical protein
MLETPWRVRASHYGFDWIGELDTHINGPDPSFIVHLDGYVHTKPLKPGRNSFRSTPVFDKQRYERLRKIIVFCAVHLSAPEPGALAEQPSVQLSACQSAQTGFRHVERLRMRCSG